jgi:DNA primase
MYALDDVLDKLLGERLGNGINAMYHCPFHGEDRTPSLSAHRDEGVWLCHTCGAKGGIEKLAHLLGEELSPSLVWDRAVRSVAEVPPVEKNFAPLANSLYERGLSDPRGDKAIRNYLSKRRISPDSRHHFWLGWDGGRISFPYWGDDARKRGSVSGIKYRDVLGTKTMEAGSKRAIYNVEDVRGAGKVVIFEGETDTILGWSRLGDGWKACGIPGASVSPRQWEIWALDFLFAQDIIVLLDADEAGDKGSETIMSILGHRARRIRPDEGLDATDHFLKHGEFPGELPTRTS